MDLIRSFIFVIILCCLFGLIFYFVGPSDTSQQFEFYLTIDTNDIDIYYLTIESSSWEESITVVNYTYSTQLPLGEYYVEACYYNVNNTMRCESQRIWLDENLEVKFFVDG